MKEDLCQTVGSMNREVRENNLRIAQEDGSRTGRRSHNRTLLPLISSQETVFNKLPLLLLNLIFVTKQDVCATS